MENQVRRAFRKSYCDLNGTQRAPVNFNLFRQRMYSAYPDCKSQVKHALKVIDEEVCFALCESFALDEQGNFKDGETVFTHLRRMRIDLGILAVRIFDKISENNRRAVAEAKNRAASKVQTADQTISQVYASVQLDDRCRHTVSGVANPRETVSPYGSSRSIHSAPRSSSSVTSSHDSLTLHQVSSSTDDILAKKLRQLHVSSKTDGIGLNQVNPAAPGRMKPDFHLFDDLLVNRTRHSEAILSSSAIEHSIRQAPLVAADIVAEYYQDFLPQYGLLGSIKNDLAAETEKQLFLNSNVPFSAFICGVQGSGKSHTTSCFLENSILASPSLGRLESPVSTLVFSYGEWSSGGAGFNISEAAFLGASHPDFPDHHVKKVTVLYSPSNAAIKRTYERLPNVEMMPFRMKARSLDIGALHTLMAIDEKATMPLYMATVEAILRAIASESLDGCLNYIEFKKRLAKEKFDVTQTTMLNMRMNLLESFLDLTDTAPMPEFKPGEVTIIDLSDPFLTPSTACILFKLGLEQFLQSRAPGKMVVLDEAHKYMLDTPGSRVFTDYLTKVIRLQRHQGARVVISTQEPTLATELIALCSVTIMHRFTSPAWYNALKQHINAVGDEKAIMQQIESLETGEALVYSPSAVLGKSEDGSLVKATGRLTKLCVRRRVTLDGGASIMAV